MLPDSGASQEEDARQANRDGYSKHDPALPLYTEPTPCVRSRSCSRSAINRPIDVAPGVEIEFVPAGHLLGSAYVHR